MFRRIVRGHLVIILFFTLVPLGAAIAYKAHQPPSYVASLRIQVVSTPASSSTEADALSSRVLALATTPSLLQAAEAHAGVYPPVDELAKNHVSAQRLGESAVVELSVSDLDRASAENLVTAITKQVVRFMNQGDKARLDDFLRSTDQKIARLRAQQAHLVKVLQALSGRRARDNIQVQLNTLAGTLNQLTTERSSLVLADATRQEVVVIHNSRPDVQMVSNGLYPTAALALLLGLVLALTLSVTLETLRPRISGIRSLARLLHAPVLGNTQRADSLANTMMLAARRQGVETLVLLGVEEKDEQIVTRMLEHLPTERAAVEPAPAPAPVKGNRGPVGNGNENGKSDAGLEEEVWSNQVRFTDLAGVRPADERTAGVVVVSTGNALQRRLDSVNDGLEAMRWPVVGVVASAPLRRWLRQQ
ncbi:MAG: hypothetical protein ACXVXE_12790 [Nocardioidaceae bacterium]